MSTSMRYADVSSMDTFWLKDGTKAIKIDNHTAQIMPMMTDIAMDPWETVFTSTPR
jgi:hypothetical protein